MFFWNVEHPPDKVDGDCGDYQGGLVSNSRIAESR